MNLCLNKPVLPAVGLTLFGWLLSLSSDVFAQPVLTLSDAINEGLQQNFQIHIAKNETDLAERNVFPGNAGYLPVITAQASVDKAIVDANVEVYTGSELSQSGAESTVTSAGIRAEWILFEGMGRSAAYEKLKEQLKISNLETRMTIEEVVADITRVYCNIIREKHLLEAWQERVLVSNSGISWLRSDVMRALLLKWSGFSRRY